MSHAGQTALVVEDDDDISELLVQVLEGLGLTVVSAGTGEEAVAAVRERRPDLVTLDLSLPDLDGTDVCRRIRGFSDAYIIMVTGRDSEVDRLVGLEVGADDYLVKPFSPRELEARASALLRRPRAGAAAADQPSGGEEPPSGEELRAGGGLVLVPVRHVALLDGKPVPLTPAEVDLLTALSSDAGRVWSRAELVREVWQGEFIESDYLVDVHVGNLRRKLRKAGGRREWIRTIGGTAYQFVGGG